jgi:hypothetical protein
MNVLNLSYKVKILALLKGGQSLAEVGCHYRKNESSICSTVLNSMHPEHYLFFLKGGLLGTTPMDTKGPPNMKICSTELTFRTQLEVTSHL